MAVQPELFDFGDETKADHPEHPAAVGQPARRASAAEPRPAERLLFRPEEAAAILGVGRTKFYELLASGAVASVHIGSARRVAMTALVDYVARLHATAAGPQRERLVAPLRTVGDPQPTAREQDQ